MTSACMYVYIHVHVTRARAHANRVATYTIGCVVTVNVRILHVRALLAFDTHAPLPRFLSVGSTALEAPIRTA